MVARDPFTEYYADLLDATYDCVDRIVINAYFPLGYSGGGFRTWWRRLYGSDEQLDNAHLMRMAGRFSRRVHAWAKKGGIPLMHCARGDRKHEIAEQYIPSNPKRCGVFLILVSRAPAVVWDVRRSSGGGIHLAKKRPLPYVNHYSFHILDKDWGHITIKMCGHPPFGAQIILNGHEYVACRTSKKGIGFSKEGNCFTDVSDSTGLARVADTLRSANAIGQLTRVCDRWIYSSCLCFALNLADQEGSGFTYRYSIYQVEYSRNLLFQRGSEMDQVFAGVIDRTRSPLDIREIKTIFGYKHRPHRRKNQKKQPRFEIVLERPQYDLLIFKVHFGRRTVKIYTKGERVLRVEAIVHNTKDLRCGKAVEKFKQIVSSLAGMVDRFLEVLRCIDKAWITDGTLEQLPKPSRLGKTRIGGLDVNKPRVRAAMLAVVALAPDPSGFTLGQFTAKMREILGADLTPRQASYDLRKLRAKRLLRRATSSRRYRATATGLRTIVALSVLREKVIKPLLAASGKLKRGRKPKHRTPVDIHYDAVQSAMRNLFQTLGIAA